jgi:hypothetical protein
MLHQKSKIVNKPAEKIAGGSEDGQKFLPPNPFPFCPPERKLSEVVVGIFLIKGSNFFQQTPQINPQI